MRNKINIHQLLLLQIFDVRKFRIQFTEFKSVENYKSNSYKSLPL